MGYPLHRVPSSGGKIYPHLSNPHHDIFSSQTPSLMTMPLQPAMNKFGGVYYPTEQGHGVYPNPSWPTITQNHSFLEPWYQTPQPTATTSLVIVSHIGIIFVTSVSHVGDSSPTSMNHVGDEPLASASHDKSMSPTIVSHVGGIHTIEKP
jgi:hypothetical protein